MVRKSPKIIKKILAFVNSYNNPDDVKGDSKPIKLYQLNVYDVSYDFAFKWYILEKEFKEVAQFIKEDISNNKKTLYLSIGEYNIELEIKEL